MSAAKNVKVVVPGSDLKDSMGLSPIPTHGQCHAKTESNPDARAWKIIESNQNLFPEGVMSALIDFALAYQRSETFAQKEFVRDATASYLAANNFTTTPEGVTVNNGVLFYPGWGFLEGTFRYEEITHFVAEVRKTLASRLSASAPMQD